MDMGGHCIDLLEMFFGKVKRVSCFIQNLVQDYPSEDSAVVNMQFENSALGVVDTFFCIPDTSSKNVLELYGSSGSIIARGTIGQAEAGIMTAYFDDSKAEYDAAQSRDSGRGIEIKPQPVNTYRAEIEEFSRAVITGGEPANNAQIALNSQRILEACYQSARTARTVEFL